MLHFSITVNSQTNIMSVPFLCVLWKWAHKMIIKSHFKGTFYFFFFISIFFALWKGAQSVFAFCNNGMLYYTKIPCICECSDPMGVLQTNFFLHSYIIYECCETNGDSHSALLLSQINWLNANTFFFLVCTLYFTF